jgi:ribosomal protein L7Ae-like RNA K-turn-binding protein
MKNHTVTMPVSEYMELLERDDENTRYKNLQSVIKRYGQVVYGQNEIEIYINNISEKDSVYIFLRDMLR